MKKGKTITQVPFSYANNQVLVSGSFSLPLYPSSFPRVLEVADSFDLFRVTKLRYRLHPADTTPASLCMAFFPGVTDTPPTTFSTISECVQRTVIAGTATVPSNWVEVPRGLLRGMHEWYKTIPGTTELAEEYPGVIYAGAPTTGAGYIKYEIEGVFEFAGPITTGSTPMERAKKRAAAERARLLRILATPDSVTSSAAAASPTPRSREG